MKCSNRCLYHRQWSSVDLRFDNDFYSYPEFRHHGASGTGRVYEESKRGDYVAYPTILGGMAFLYCQYLEWTHLMHQGMSMSFNPI